MKKTYLRMGMILLLLAAFLLVAAACSGEDPVPGTTGSGETAGTASPETTTAGATEPPEPPVTSYFTEGTKQYKLKADYTLADGDCVSFPTSIELDLGGNTLDLAGKTFTVAGERSQGNLAVKNGTVKNGTLCLSMASGSVVLDHVTADASVAVILQGDTVCNTLLAERLTHSGGKLSVNAGSVVVSCLTSSPDVTVAEKAGVSLLSLSGDANVTIGGSVLYLETAGGAKITLNTLENAVIADIGARGDLAVSTAETAFIRSVAKLSGAKVTPDTLKTTDTTEEGIAKGASEALRYRFESASAPDCKNGGGVRFVPIDSSEKRADVEIPLEKRQHHYVMTSSAVPGLFRDGNEHYECTECLDRYVVILPSTRQISDCETLSDLLLLYVSDGNRSYDIDEDLVLIDGENPVAIHSLHLHTIVKDGKADGSLTMTASASGTEYDIRAYLKDDKLTIWYSENGEDGRTIDTTPDMLLSMMIVLLSEGETDSEEILSSIQTAVADAAPFRIDTYFTDEELNFLKSVLSMVASLADGGAQPLQETAAEVPVSGLPDFITVTEDPQTGKTIYSLDPEKTRAFLAAFPDMTISEVFTSLTGTDLSMLPLLLETFRTLPNSTVISVMQTVSSISDATGIPRDEMLSLINSLLSAACGKEIALEKLLVSQGLQPLSTAIGLDSATWNALLAAVPRVLELKIASAYDLLVYSVIGNSEVGSLLSFDSTFGSIDPEGFEELTVTEKDGDVIGVVLKFGGLSVEYDSTENEVKISSGEDRYRLSIDAENGVLTLYRVGDGTEEKLGSFRHQAERSKETYEISFDGYAFGLVIPELKEENDIIITYTIPVEILGKQIPIKGIQTIHLTLNETGFAAETKLGNKIISLTGTETNGETVFVFQIKTAAKLIPLTPAVVNFELHVTVDADGNISAEVTVPEGTDAPQPAPEEGEELISFEKFFEGINLEV